MGRHAKPNLESVLMRQCLMELSRRGARVFRNNTAMGWAGQIVDRTGPYLRLLNAYPLHAGLCIGSSDVIGWMPITVTPEMVGKTVGLFLACECKSAGEKPTENQAIFLRNVREAGGVAIWLRDVDELDAKLEEALEALT